MLPLAQAGGLQENLLHHPNWMGEQNMKDPRTLQELLDDAFGLFYDARNVMRDLESMLDQLEEQLVKLENNLPDEQSN